MAEEKKDPDTILQSWKEISAYLGCDERTAQRWEKEFGLPVRRLSDSPRSRVYAKKKEIDTWLEDRLEKSVFADDNDIHRYRKGRPFSELRDWIPTRGEGLQPKADEVPGTMYRDPIRQRQRRGLLRLAGGGLVAVTAAFVFLSPRMERVPADHRVEGTSLIVLDAKGRDFWRYETTLPDPITTPLLGPNSNTRAIGEDGLLSLPRLLIQDITGDGRPEVLFYPTDDSGRPAGGLHCFSARGRLLWTFDPGRPVRFGRQTYGSEYYGRFAALDLDGDGRYKILLISNPRGYFPTVASLLNADGRLLGEYWNSGHIQDVGVFDIDGDGRNEIILGAMNNEYRTGVLIALDPGDMGGASPQQNPHYANPELGPGKEKYYIRFPRNAVDDALAYIAAMNQLTIQPSDRILIATFIPSFIQYTMSIGLDSILPRISHGFEKLYTDLYRQGRIAAPFDREALRSELGEGIHWWDGEEWSQEPAMTKYWRDKTAARPRPLWPEI